AAATGGVLKKNAKPIAVTFVVHSRLFATSLLNFGIIVNLDNLISLPPPHPSSAPSRSRSSSSRHRLPANRSHILGGCAYQKSRPYDLITESLSAGHDGRTNIPLLEPGLLHSSSPRDGVIVPRRTAACLIYSTWRPSG